MGAVPVRLLSLVLLLVSVPVVAPRPDQTSSGQDLQLRAVRVTGARRYTESDVIKVSGLEIGKPISVADLKAAADRMADSGLFQTVKYRYATAGREISATFEIEEPAWTVPVLFDNFIWLADEDLIAAVRQEVPSFDGTSPASGGAPDLITHALQNVLKKHNIEGRVEFAPQIDLKTKSQQYVFSVKDPTPKICTLRVDGASAVPERELVDALKSTIGGDYSRFYVTKASNGTLIDLYRRRGHWRAIFGPASVAVGAAGCNGANVTLHVNEGAAYAWDRAVWTPNAAQQIGNLDSLLGMKSGEVADASKIDDGLRRIAKAYGTQGYIMEAATYTQQLDDSARRATFQIAIEEGPQFHAGAVEFIGLSDADANALRKKWRLKSGDVYDDSYVGKFQIEETMHVQRGSTQPPRPAQMETRVDAEKRIVDVRFIFR